MLRDELKFKNGQNILHKSYSWIYIQTAIVSHKLSLLFVAYLVYGRTFTYKVWRNLKKNMTWRTKVMYWIMSWIEKSFRSVRTGWLFPYGVLRSEKKIWQRRRMKSVVSEGAHSGKQFEMKRRSPLRIEKHFQLRFSSLIYSCHSSDWQIFHT